MDLVNSRQIGVNDSGTAGYIDTPLTQPSSRSVHMINDFDGPKIRKHLEAMRRQHGADSPIGNRCSNLVAQLAFLPDTKGALRKDLEKHIAKSVEDLARLTTR